MPRGAVPPEQIRDLLLRAEEKDLENEKQLRDYTYIEREEQHKLDGHGGVKKTESRTSGGPRDLRRASRAADRER